MNDEIKINIEKKDSIITDPVPVILEKYITDLNSSLIKDLNDKAYSNEKDHIINSKIKKDY